MAYAIALFPRCRRRAVTAKKFHQYTVLFGSRYSSTLLRSTIVVGITRTGSTISPFSTEIAISTASRTISGAVQRGADVDVFVFLDDLEVFLASAAAGDDLDVGAAGIFDRLKHANRGFVIQAANRVNLLVRREDIGEVASGRLHG